MDNHSLPVEVPSDDLVPESIQGYISVTGEASVFSNAPKKFLEHSSAFQANKESRDRVGSLLLKSGFTVLAESPLGFAVTGPAGAYEEITGGTVETRERLMYAEANQSRYVTHVDIVGRNQPKALGVAHAKSKTARIDGVLVQRPRVFMGISPSPIPPLSNRFHLRVPNDVALGLNAHRAHRAGHFGEGVTVAMPDSGQYRHPFFAAQGYNVRPVITVVPGTSPSKDPVGHGTGESANIFAAAPGATLQAIRSASNNGALVGAVSGFMRAKELKPQVITCSWGGDGIFPTNNPPDQFDMAFALEIQNAIEQGIVVVFSAGNGQFSIEPQVPGVIAAGGVFMEHDLSLSASDYASGYKSPWFQDVTVPTVCGLVGMRPRAQYLMLPVQPGCQIDIAESQSIPSDPADGTTDRDGWALFSGTSAAAPQVAGVIALILGAKPNLTPSQVTEALTRTATDIVTGRCHPRFNELAQPGHDVATGSGLINALDAVNYAVSNF